MANADLDGPLVLGGVPLIHQVRHHLILAGREHLLRNAVTRSRIDERPSTPRARQRRGQRAVEVGHQDKAAFRPRQFERAVEDDGQHLFQHA